MQKKCTDCLLHKNAHNVINGNGSVPAKILIINEFPDKEEDLLGEPLVGESAQLLNFLLNKVGINSSYITYAVKCKPKTRPTKNEIHICKKYLLKEIDEVKPEVIITLGSIALQSLFPKLALKNNLLRVFKFNGRKIIPTISIAQAIKNSKSSNIAWIEAGLKIANRLIKNDPTNIKRDSIIIKNIEQIPEFSVCAIDYEEINNIKAYGIYANKKHYFYIGDLSKLKTLFENENISKIVYSAPHEKAFLEKYNIILKNSFDMYPAFYLLNENYPSYSLKFAASILFGVPNYGIDFDSMISIEELKNYNLKDCYYTYNIKNKIIKKLKEKNLLNLYYNLAVPLSYIMFELNNNGILVDTIKLNFKIEEIKTKLQSLHAFMEQTIKKQFNPRSTKQLQDILNDLNLKTDEITAGGKMSTNKRALSKIDNNIIKLILEYRQLEKRKEMLENIKAHIQSDNRIHSHYIFGTETGRLSSFDLNMQNIPPELRDLFVVPPDSIFVKLDFSQIELRILAFIAQDTKMIKAFADLNTDIHSFVASLVFKKTNIKYRTYAKKIVFGLIYGMGTGRLAKELNIKKEKAEKYKNKILKIFNTLETFQKKCIKDINIYRELINPFGRRRRFDYLYNKAALNKAYREGINFMVQSTASDIVQLFFINLCNDLKSKGIKIINFVHDEGDFEVKKELYPDFRKIVENNANKFKAFVKEKFNIDLNVTLIIEESIGPNWKDLTKNFNYVIR